MSRSSLADGEEAAVEKTVLLSSMEGRLTGFLYKGSEIVVWRWQWKKGGYQPHCPVSGVARGCLHSLHLRGLRGKSILEEPVLREGRGTEHLQRSSLVIE